MKTELIYHQVESFVDEIDRNKRDYVINPMRDHTRTRKISFKDCLLSSLCMSGGTLFSEVLEYYESRSSIPSTSAFVQQRAKVKTSAFEKMFQMSSSLCNCKLYKGYRLLAVDGSDVRIPLNPSDLDTYCPGTHGQQPYNLLHLNAIYDLLSRSYTNAIVQGHRSCNEYDAAVKMVDSSDISHAILIADRGYESYNLMAHCQEKGWKYIIRIKDCTSNGMARKLGLKESSEYDDLVDLKITRKNSNYTKALFNNFPNEYRYLPPTARFDYLPKISKYKEDPVFYSLSFRIVQIEIQDGIYETLVTNLDQSEFSSEELKSLYRMRWGIETSFRTLKYNVGLLYTHSKCKRFIIQEIFARLTMYNIILAICSNVNLDNAGSKKYAYVVNVAHAVHICRKLFLHRLSPPQAEQLLSRSVVPVRNGRSFERRHGTRIAINLVYRVA